MSLKFGLNLKNKAPNGLAKPGAKPALKKKKPLLDDEEEDTKNPSAPADAAQEIGEFNFDDTLTTTTSESSKPAAPTKPKKGQPPAPPTRKPKPKPDDPTLLANSYSAKEAEQRAQDALKEDAKLYDYDAAYDALHAASALKKAAEAADPLARAPKYMDSLHAAATQRKADQARARDKFLQRERATEGDAFADKEKFVTGAYKTQQEEHARLEEEERVRLAREEDERRKFGMLGFHKRMLEERERQHREAVEAAERARRDGVVVLPVPAEEEGKLSEAQQVEQLRAQGKDILLNEEGQVADKRQLLKGGLNIIAKPKPPASTTATAAAARQTLPVHAPSKAGRIAQRERQTQMVAQQIEAAAKRKADEEADEAAKLQHAAKSQKTQADVTSAKERYLQRKAAAAKEKDKAGK